MSGWRHRSRTQAGVLALGIVSSLAMAGCAESTEDTSGGSGDGVPAGAAMADYQAAFEDIAPITLRAQSPAPKGSDTGAPVEKWAAAVQEWSGGKITFDIAFSSAVAGPTERVAALNDGRLDAVGILPIYEPDEWPKNAALLDTGFISDQTPVTGALQSNAWPNEVAFNTAEVMDEFDQHGVVPLVPSYNSGATLMYCTESRTSLADFDGVVSSAAGRTNIQQLEALGITPTSIVYTELFESLQRGVIECANAPGSVAVLGGFLPEAPHLTTSADAGFSVAPGAFAFSKARWEELPLVARQLLWDKLDVYLASNIEDNIFTNTSLVAKTIRENNGSVSDFADDAANALRTENDALLDELRTSDAVSDPDALVDDSLAAADKWLTELESLNISDTYSYETFDQDLAANPVDLTAYTRLLMEKAWSAQRPE